MMGSENDNAQRDRDRSRRGDRPSRFSDAQRDRSQDKSDCKRLLVSNIPYEYRWTELKDLFKDRVGDVAFVELFNDENGKPRGCGVVEFTNADACKKALTVMHRYELNGRKLVLKEDPASGQGRRTGNRDRAGGARGRDDKDRSYDRAPDNFNDANDPERFNLYGLSTQFLDSINVQPPLVKKVFVANLDYKADRAKIKEIFKMAGKVRNIDLAVDKDGNSRGFAVVEFDHPVEAVQAISMFDKQMLFERRMTVRMDRASSDKPPELKLPEGLKSIGFGLGPNGDPLRDVARNLPQIQSQNSNMGMANTTGGLGNSVLGNVPGAGVALNGLGGGIGAGLNANAALSGSLGLQALGLTGLGALQSQLLTQGLAANDLTANIASALQAQGINANLGGLGNDMTGANSLASSNLNASNVLGSSGLNNSSLNSRQGNSIPQSSSYGRQNNLGNTAGGGGRGASNVGGGASYQRDSAPAPRDNKISDMVVITNLPPTVTWQLIREKFSECGDVKFAEMTGSDTAIVRFHKEWDAERAVKMFDRTRIDGRTIDVRFF